MQETWLAEMVRSSVAATGCSSQKHGWRSSAFYLLPSAFCLLFSGCSRPPQNAAELQAKLPAQYQGELHLQGEREAHRIVLEPHDFTVRDSQTLEFKHVRYQFYTGNAIVGQGEADLQGTISAPGLNLQVENFGGSDGSDALKPGTFVGTLSQDLKKLDATWKSGFDQTVSLQATATP